MGAYIDEHADQRDANGHRLVVRNGHKDKRQIQTGIGPVTVRQARRQAQPAIHLTQQQSAGIGGQPTGEGGKRTPHKLSAARGTRKPRSPCGAVGYAPGAERPVIGLCDKQVGSRRPDFSLNPISVGV